MTSPLITFKNQVNYLFYCLQYCSKIEKTFTPSERFAINYKSAILLEELYCLKNNIEPKRTYELNIKLDIKIQNILSKIINNDYNFEKRIE